MVGVIQPSVCDGQVLKAFCESIQLQIPCVEHLCLDAETVNQLDCQASQFKQIDWTEVQDKDPVIRNWIDVVKSGRKPKMDDLPPSHHPLTLIRNFHSLTLENDILQRKIQIDGKVRRQFIVPKELIPVVLKNLHNDFGHPGRDRLLSLVKDRFYWPGVNNDIDKWIKGCHRCLRRKVPPNQRAPLMPIQTSYPLELVCMDFLTLEPSKGGYHHILIITDHFTRFAQAIPTKNQTARTTAEALYHNFLTKYGFPTRIHSDQGANFDGKIIKELCNITGMRKSRTTPYHPMGNGMCERFNRTLMDMLGTLQPSQKSNWKAHVSPLVHAYNSTRHESTGQSPYLLMFGREPRLPVDIAFGIGDQEKKSLPKYVEELRKRMKDAYELAFQAAEKARKKQGKYYDLKVRGVNVQPGDRVLVKIVAFDGKHKIADRWEEEPYQILRQPNPDVPVYVVKREDGTGRLRTLHRNLLLPIGHIDPDERSLATEKPIPKPRQKKTQLNQEEHQEELTNTEEEVREDTDLSDSEDEIYFQIPVPVTKPAHRDEQNVIVERAAAPRMVEPVPEPEGETREIPTTQADEGGGSEQQAGVVEIENVPLRRSARPKRPPRHLDDYKVNMISDRKVDILRQLFVITEVPEERNILLKSIIDIVNKD